MNEIFLKLFDRDLNKLKDEIGAYKDEKKLWIISGETHQIGGQVKNSGGNLCLHLCGNLQHFIGATLGNSGYVRNREAEFNSKNISVSDLLKEIDNTIAAVEKSLNDLKEEKLNGIFPINVFGYEMTTGYFLVHLTAHLGYHLGQINYHRRLLDN